VVFAFFVFETDLTRRAGEGERRFATKGMEGTEDTEDTKGTKDTEGTKDFMGFS